MREATPYIKKPSLVSDLPWDGAFPHSPSLSLSEESGSPKHQSAPQDRKIIPLKMCYAARNLSMPDLENRSGGGQAEGFAGQQLSPYMRTSNLGWLPGCS